MRGAAAFGHVRQNIDFPARMLKLFRLIGDLPIKILLPGIYEQ